MTLRSTRTDRRIIWKDDCLPERHAEYVPGSSLAPELPLVSKVLVGVLKTATS
jgi:hypothetical protein